MYQKPIPQFFLWFILFSLCITCNQSVQTVAPVVEKSIVQDHSALMSAMKAYVDAEDPAFDYKLVDEIEEEGYTLYVIRMVSQNWLTTKEVKDPTWWHWLTVVVPDGAISNTAMLVIGGGSYKTKQPSKADPLTLQSALATQSIVANLHNIPNQKVEFVGDDYGPREEDELIAYGWRKFLEGGAQLADTKWLARLPMTKASVSALDVLSDFTIKNSAFTTVDQFVVTGASKRGWTTWTTAAVDDRVIAIAPIVIDMLNMVPSFQHHWQAYGKWAPAIGNYDQEGIMEWQDSYEYWRLAQVTEPYTFIESLSLPKLLINGTGDQFFLPDSWQFYWNDLKGEKHLRYVPNSEHSMGGTDALETLISFYQMILKKHPRPKFKWQVVNGEIVIQTEENYPPTTIRLWQAHNPEARTFQVDAIGRAYKDTQIPISKNGKYAIKIPAPKEGWTAFYVELDFPGAGTIPLKLSTGVVVTPDIYPFEKFNSSKPMGTKR